MGEWSMPLHHHFIPWKMRRHPFWRTSSGSQVRRREAKVSFPNRGPNRRPRSAVPATLLHAPLTYLYNVSTTGYYTHEGGWWYIGIKALASTLQEKLPFQRSPTAVPSTDLSNLGPVGHWKQPPRWSRLTAGEVQLPSPELALCQDSVLVPTLRQQIP